MDPMVEPAKVCCLACRRVYEVPVWASSPAVAHEVHALMRHPDDDEAVVKALRRP